MIHKVTYMGYTLISSYRTGQGPVDRPNPKKAGKENRAEWVKSDSRVINTVYKGMIGRRRIMELHPRVAKPTRFIIMYTCQQSISRHTKLQAFFLLKIALVNFLKKWIPPAF